MRTQPHYFRLGWIESQSAGTHLVINFTDARGEALLCHFTSARAAFLAILSKKNYFYRTDADYIVGPAF